MGTLLAGVLATRKPAFFISGHTSRSLSNSSLTRHDEKGMTLIEVIIAFTVIVVAIVSLLMVITNSIRIKEMNRELTMAEQAMNDKVSEIKAKTFDDIVPDYSAGGTPGNTFTVPALPASGGAITIDATNEYLLDISITITWTGISGTAQTYSYKNMITR